jgi:hypothetical protein
MRSGLLVAMVLGTALVSSACSGDNGEGEDSSSADLGTKTPAPSGAAATVMPAIKSVFVIVMENHAWSAIKGNPSAPYINGTLLSQGAHAENYFNPPKNHPSEPNYIWLEAGDNLGITTDADPSATHSLATTDHLASQLEVAGKSWHFYEEGIQAGTCPVASTGLYAAKHNPVVFFNDVSGSPPSPTSPLCIQNVRPLSELAGDLKSDNDADYNFITPNLCNDMHGASGCPRDLVKAGDDFLASVVPMIMASESYTDAGAIFITWDESERGDFPIGMIVLSPFARPGYAGSVAYTHSSTLRTVEDIFGLTPLRGAATATPLLDLFMGTPAMPGDAGAPGTPSGKYFTTPDGHLLPNPALTPGKVLTADLAALCKSGYSATVRSVNAAEKAQVAASYDYTGPSSGVEYDHLISLELGGSNDPANLWPEPIADAHVKDGLENYLRPHVCAGDLALADVQQRLATDWVKLWNEMGNPSATHPGLLHPH